MRDLGVVGIALVMLFVGVFVGAIWQDQHLRPQVEQAQQVSSGAVKLIDRQVNDRTLSMQKQLNTILEQKTNEYNTLLRVQNVEHNVRMAAAVKQYVERLNAKDRDCTAMVKLAAQGILHVESK